MKGTGVSPSPSVEFDDMFLFVLVIPAVLELLRAVLAARLQAIAIGTVDVTIHRKLDQAAPATLFLGRYVCHLAVHKRKPLLLDLRTETVYFMPPVRFELTTFHLRGGRSNQLSYEGFVCLPAKNKHIILREGGKSKPFTQNRCRNFPC